MNYPIRYYICRILLTLFFIFPIKNKRVYFKSYFGKYYNDNPKAISSALKLYNSDVEIVWSMKNPKELNEENIIVTKTNTLKDLYYIATSRVWVDNCRKGAWVKKRKKQYYIQTWHAGITMKYVEADAAAKLPKEYRFNAINDGKMSDLMISNSSWCTQLYKRAFWFSGDIAEIGTPRIDRLINYSEEKAFETKRKMGIPDDSHVVLYAPTFRNNGGFEIYNSLDMKAICDLLSNMYGDDWLPLIRLHPNLKNSDGFDTKGAMNVTDYGDVYELIGISDIFITDYSSTMFEAAYCGKKTILYVPDIEQYTSEREQYFKFENLPFPLAENMEEMSKALQDAFNSEYLTKVEHFFKSIDVREDGHASEKAAKIICEIINKV